MSKPAASQVPRLPRLVAVSSSWRLPLSDHASSELARILVVDRPAERQTWVAELMSVDPCLTLWTACVAGPAFGGEGKRADAAEEECAGNQAGAGCVAPRCVMDLAQWLARHALQVLRWSADELAETRELPVVRMRWRQLAADAVAVASLAADPVSDDSVAAEAFLFGLLHNAADWLRSCGPRVSLAKHQLGPLPSWLVTMLRQRSHPPQCEPVRHVTRAARLWRESGRRKRHVAGIDLTEALVAGRRWQPVGRSGETSRHLLIGLTDRLRRLQQIEHDFAATLEREKLESLGELAYGASHEINNPLANISTRAQALLCGESDPERRRMLAIINTQALRANEMIADMMLFARPPELVYRDVDLVELADSVADELSDEAQRQGTRLDRRGGTDKLVLPVDPVQLAMAVRAICVNALQALGAEGEIELSIEQLGPAPGSLLPTARIVIRDSGPGIPPHVRRHLFDPFYSGREAGRGLGLGLAKCWRVITLHGGRIEVSSPPRQGTTFSIYLPAPAHLAPEEGRPAP